MEQLKSQVVFEEDVGVEARSPEVPADLYSTPTIYVTLWRSTLMKVGQGLRPRRRITW